VLGRRVREQVLAAAEPRWVIDGIRNPAEVLELKKTGGFYLLGIDCDVPIILARMKRRGRASDAVAEKELRAALGQQSTTAYPEGDSGERAFFRDLATLRDAGIPLEERDDAYTIRREDYYLPSSTLRDAQFPNLAATGRLHAQLVDLGGVEAGRPGGGQDQVAVVASQEHLPVLFAACGDRRRVRFTHGERERVVDAWGLLLREGYWYLFGWYADAGGWRFFKVDRMTGPVLDAGPSEHPEPDFDAAACSRRPRSWAATRW
jgi:hypothetical protein